MLTIDKSRWIDSLMKKKIKRNYNRTNLVINPDQRKKLEFLSAFLIGNPKFSPLVRQAIDSFFETQLRNNSFLKMEWEKIKKEKGDIYRVLANDKQ